MDKVIALGYYKGIASAYNKDIVQGYDRKLSCLLLR